MSKFTTLLIIASFYTSILFAQFEDALRIIETIDKSVILERTIQTDTLSTTYYLTLVQRAHPDIRSAAAGVDRARGSETAAWGLLDPRIGGSLSARQFSGGIKNNDLTAALTVPLYWGQQITVGYRRSTEFFNQDYITTDAGEPSVGLILPLLRNVQIDPTRTSILRAEQARYSAEAAYRERRNLVSLVALNDYYTWAASRARYTVAEQLYLVARDRYRWVIAEIQRGERAPIDSVELLQEVFRRRSLLVRARNQLERSSLILWLNLWGIEWDRPSRLATFEPEPFPALQFLEPVQIDFDRRRALQRRPELQRVQAEYEQLTIDQRLANEQIKPLLNASVSVYSPAWSQPLSQMPTFWRAGLVFELPLLYRRPLGVSEEVRAQRVQLEASIELLRRRIENDVLIGAANVNATYEQAILARAERIAAERMVEAERRLFERGESDLLRLNLRERLLAEAQEREIEALQLHASAQAFYRWAIADY